MPQHPDRRLAEDLLRDQRERWANGRGRLVEEYLAEHAWLRGERGLLIDLIRAEYVFQQKSDVAVTPAEFLRRFPDLKQELIEALSTAANTCTMPQESDAVPPASSDDTHSLRAANPDSTLSFAAPQVDAPRKAPRDAAKLSLPGYEVLGELGRGGMGVVYRARHLRLNRTVALKMIRGAGQVEEETLARFQREAEAVAQVQHPNIVQIHEIGDHDGQPFFSLEYVAGGSLDRLVAGEPFPTREVAGLVEIVARAMHFAHQRGIVHRDLKPANILMQKDEQGSREAATANRPSLAEFIPKITDFGLAKQLDNDATATRSGAVMGTPSYMAPEQAQGRTGEIGPLADVYALGAILYNLLTGRPPFRADNVVDTLRLVIETEPVSPRLLNPTLDRDLETICLKCLSKEPTRRYATASELADDLHRYVNNEPIQARPISGAARAWRYCRRRRLVTSLAALFVISLLAGTAISTYFGVLANNRARLLQTANTNLSAANATAETRRIAAENAAVVAREQSQLALKSLESVIFDIQRKLVRVPGAGDLRRSLLQNALARLKEVSDKFASRAMIDKNTAAALTELGDLLLRIGSEGDKEGAALTAARKLYEQAFGISKRLADANPNDAEAQRDLSVSYDNLGEVQLQSGQVADALESYRRGLEISRKLATDNPGDILAQRDLSTWHDNLGDALLRSGQTKEASDSYAEGLRINQGLVDAEPTDAESRRDLSIAFGKLGDAQRQRGQAAAALASYKRAVEVGQTATVADPNDTSAWRNVAVSYERLGNLLMQSGQPTEALASYRQALEIFERLTTADPSDIQARRNLSVVFEKLGDVQLALGKTTDAIDMHRRAFEIRQQAAKTDSSDPEALRDLSISLGKLGESLRQSGRTREALASHLQAFDLNLKLAAAESSDLRAQRDLAVSYDRLGNLRRESGEASAALESYRQAFNIKRKLFEADPNDGRARRDLSVSCNKLGDMQLQAGRAIEALEHFRAGLEHSRILADANPSDAQSQLDLAVSYYKVASALQNQRQYDQAIEYYRQEVELLQAMADQDRLAPANAKWIGIAERAIQQCKRFGIATGDWDALLENPAELLPVLLEMRAVEFVQSGRAGEAVQAVAKLRQLAAATPEQLYNAACVYCLCAGGVKAEKDTLTAEQSTARQKHLADAIESLREAIKAGYQDFAHLQQDPDLAPLRNLPEYKDLLPKSPEKSEADRAETTP